MHPLDSSTTLLHWHGPNDKLKELALVGSRRMKNIGGEKERGMQRRVTQAKKLMSARSNSRTSGLLFKTVNLMFCTVEQVSK